MSLLGNGWGGRITTLPFKSLIYIGFFYSIGVIGVKFGVFIHTQTWVPPSHTLCTIAAPIWHQIHRPTATRLAAKPQLGFDRGKRCIDGERQLFPPNSATVPTIVVQASDEAACQSHLLQRSNSRWC